MKWPPSEFWMATPYDCFLAAGGMAKLNQPSKGKLSKSDVKRLKELLEKDRLKNG